ncbi:MAG: Verru_Chthon cassette protein C [Verrucomicrobiota bacterium]|nr:Verru_Chthon cassette protein C [Verrucomicrobiota bacterium]
MNACSQAPSRRRGFTLVELLLSTTVMAVLVVILASITGQTSTIWRSTTGKVEQFREARAAFDTMSTRLSQATLNTYWDYFDQAGEPRSPSNAQDFVPAKYGRQSELRFICGDADALLGAGPAGKRVGHGVFFHAPLGRVDDSNTTNTASFQGLDNLLNVTGYYSEFRDDRDLRPAFITPGIAPLKHRFRLMEFMQPSQQLETYMNATDWFQSAANAQPAPVHVLAENIVALVITPRLPRREEENIKGMTADPDSSPLAPDYSYDSISTGAAASAAPQWQGAVNSKNQLPPVLQITMVAIDETSASRLNLDSGSADIFKIEGKFQKTAKYSDDLLTASGSKASLEDELIARRVNYRIFTTNISILAAKWSREQTH